MSDDDTITVRGLRVRGHHGVLPEERANGQVFVVDAELSVDMSRAAMTGNLDDTVDYAGLAAQLAEVVGGSPVDLIETLADRLVAVCLSDPRVRRATVTVHKPEAPVGLPVDDVTVRMTRGRA